MFYGIWNYYSQQPEFDQCAYKIAKSHIMLVLKEAFRVGLVDNQEAIWS